MSTPTPMRSLRRVLGLMVLTLGLLLAAGLSLAVPRAAQAEPFQAGSQAVAQSGLQAPLPQDAPWVGPGSPAATPAVPPANTAPTPSAAFQGARGQGVQAPAPVAVAARSSEPSPSPPAGLDLLDRGEFAAAAGRFDEAERLWRQALAQRPDWTVVKQRLAELPARRARFAPELAEQERRREARLDLVQGVSDFNAQRYRQAQENFERFLKVFPEDEEGRYYLDLAKANGGGVGPGRLKVVCAPEAQVLLDGRPVGRTPLLLSAPPGKHKVEVRAHGGSDSREVPMPAGGEAQVSFTLLGGFMAVNAQPWAQVLLDGKPQGTTPLTLENLVLGPHTVTARHPGYAEQSQQVVLTRGQTLSVQFTLDKR